MSHHLVKRDRRQDGDEIRVLIRDLISAATCMDIGPGGVAEAYADIYGNWYGCWECKSLQEFQEEYGQENPEILDADPHRAYLGIDWNDGAILVELPEAAR